jgi:hypothetical protein
MCGAFDAFRDSQDNEAQLEQKADHKDADEESHNSCDEIDQPLGGRTLEAQHNVSDYSNSTGENVDDIEKLHDAARELLLEGKINKARKEVLIVGHASSWHEYQRLSWRRDVGKAIQ